MGILANFLDKFKAKDFSISPNKKIKTIQSEFKENFGLSLRVYKGNQLADPSLTIAGLNGKVSGKIDATKDDLSIKASMTIAEIEKAVKDHFGLKVQVANEFDTYLVGNQYTLGQASRKDDLKDWCKGKGYKSIEEWLQKENCSSIEEYYKKSMR